MSIQHEDFSADRNESIANRIDSFGKKWTIEHKPRSAFFRAKAEPAPANYAYPNKLLGDWTSKVFLEEQIQIHLKNSWDKADEKGKPLAASSTAKKSVSSK